MEEIRYLFQTHIIVHHLQEVLNHVTQLFKAFSLCAHQLEQHPQQVHVLHHLLLSLNIHKPHMIHYTPVSVHDHLTYSFDGFLHYSFSTSSHAALRLQY